MRHLCDSNVFIALTLESHPHHRQAVAWLEDLEPGDRLMFCRVTQNTYLRLLTLKEWMKENVCTNDEAVAQYLKLRSDDRIGFLPEPPEVEKQWFEYASSNQSAPKRWMDAYLAALARAVGMPMVTFDAGFSNFAGLNLVVLRG